MNRILMFERITMCYMMRPMLCLSAVSDLAIAIANIVVYVETTNVETTCRNMSQLLLTYGIITLLSSITTYAYYRRMRNDYNAKKSGFDKCISFAFMVINLISAIIYINITDVCKHEYKDKTESFYQMFIINMIYFMYTAVADIIYGCHLAIVESEGGLDSLYLNNGDRVVVNRMANPDERNPDHNPDHYVLPFIPPPPQGPAPEGNRIPLGYYRSRLFPHIIHNPTFPETLVVSEQPPTYQSATQYLDSPASDNSTEILV